VACRIQEQATRKKPQEVDFLQTQKEVLAHALFLGCTICPKALQEIINSKHHWQYTKTPSTSGVHNKISARKQYIPLCHNIAFTCGKE